MGYSNIFVTAPSPENLNTLFEFVVKVDSHPCALKDAITRCMYWYPFRNCTVKCREDASTCAFKGFCDFRQRSSVPCVTVCAYT